MSELEEPVVKTPSERVEEIRAALPDRVRSQVQVFYKRNVRDVAKVRIVRNNTRTPVRKGGSS